LRAGHREKNDPATSLECAATSGAITPPFAVANEAGFLWVNFLAGFQ